MQLSVKALLQPFNVGLSRKAADDDNETTQDDNGDQTIFEDDEEHKEHGKEQAEEVDYKDDNIDELAELSKDEQTWVLEETMAVQDTVTKVSHPIMNQKMFSFSY